MRLAINGYRLEGPQTGVARYLVSLLREWDLRPGPLRQIHLFSRLAAGDPRLREFRSIRHVSLVPWLPYGVCEQLLLPASGEADVLFCPANTMPVGYRKPSVVMVHDTLQEIMPRSFSLWARCRYTWLYRLSAKRATLVLTNSENTKADVVRHFKVPPEKVRVIPLAAAECFRVRPDTGPAAAALGQRGLGPRPFLLFVGKLSVRRCVPMLIRVFGQLVHRDRLAHQLVIVGQNHLGLPLKELARAFGIDDRILHLPRVSDEELVALYNRADCLVLPSLYEGFGLPIVEAMACGCPVIVFRNSALAEVGAGAVHYPASSSAEGLLEALQAVLSSPVLRAELRQKGLERAREFSWNRTARETLAALEQAAGA